MMFKQPHVPEYRDGDGIERYIRRLTLFLRDFCQEVWASSRRQAKEIDALRREIESIRESAV